MPGTGEGGRHPGADHRNPGRMPHRIALPPQLGPVFSVRDAARAGVGRSRYSSGDLARPFDGIRTTRQPDTFAEVVASYLPRLRTGQAFAGRTAARIWGIPLPMPWRRGELLDIAVDTGTSPPRTVGVHGRRLHPRRRAVIEVDGMPVLDPIATVFVCAAELTPLHTVIAVEALISAAPNYPGLRADRPAISIGDIANRLATWGRFRGSPAVRAALDMVRVGSESPKETETRMLLRRVGLPEPELQHVVRVDGRFVARVDLAYPRWRIAIEYEGDGHRTDREQWRRDIRRQRDLEDHGWIVIRVTQLDLAHGGAALASRIRRAIASRG